MRNTIAGAAILFLFGCQTPAPTRDASNGDLQNQISRQSQVIADQQRELQAVKDQQHPATRIFQDTVGQTYGFSLLNSCWDVKAIVGQAGELVNDESYMRVISSKLSPECGRKQKGGRYDKTFLGMDKGIEACPTLALLFDYVSRLNPDARPEALSEAAFRLRLVIVSCYDVSAMARLRAYTSPPVPQAPRPRKPDCNDFDAVVSHIRNNAIAAGLDMNDPIAGQAILQSARQYQVDHGCRAPAQGYRI